MPPRQALSGGKAMIRVTCCVLVLLAGVTRAAAPPAPTERQLTLKEAVASALRKAGHRVESVDGTMKVHLRPGRPVESRRAVNQVVLNVAVAYGNLATARATLTSREVGVYLARQTWADVKRRRAPLAELAQARGQLTLFLDQREQAEDAVTENERQLSALTDLPEIRGRWVPVDASPRLGFSPDWNASLTEALAARPELLLARHNVASWRSLVACEVTASRWLGWEPPAGPLDLRRHLAGAVGQLVEQERKAESLLYLYHKRLLTSQEQIKANRAQREAFSEQVRVRRRDYEAGRGTLDSLLETQRFYLDAMANERQAVTSYSNARAGFAYARGTTFLPLLVEPSR
jgi:outer membrane protein TolC